MKEEINLSIKIKGLLIVDYSPNGKNYAEGLEFIFDGGFVSDEQIANIKLPSDELSEYKFVPENQLESLLVSRLYYRVLKSLSAQKYNSTYYTESQKGVFPNHI